MLDERKHTVNIRGWLLGARQPQDGVQLIDSPIGFDPRIVF